VGLRNIALVVMFSMFCILLGVLMALGDFTGGAPGGFQMSKGVLDTPVGVESRDEVGDLALSLEHMRASLKAAMIRLNQQDVRRRA
jgi:nitrate/nitrite-specific signal transduction histidine kinase